MLRPLAGLSNQRSFAMSPQPQLDCLVSGLAFGESPRWHEGRLWFCNWGTGEIVAMDEAGSSQVMLHVPTTLPYCIDWLPDGRLLVLSGREALLLRQEASGELVTHCDLRSLSRQPWNEIVIDTAGNIYVNGGGPTPPEGQMFGPGTITLIRPDGSATVVADGIAFANGMAISPDGKTLICAESFGRSLLGFDIAADGTLSNRRVWAALGSGTPDGISMDAEGAVWYADVPNKCCVRVREGGEILDRIELDRGGFACMLGGADRRTLFILASEFRGFEHMFSDRRDGVVYATRVAVPGAGRP
jgi:sugar lactone lactonase YvrE